MESQYLSFCVHLISLVFPRSLHVAACVRISFPFKAEYYPFACSLTFLSCSLNAPHCCFMGLLAAALSCQAIRRRLSSSLSAFWLSIVFSIMCTSFFTFNISFAFACEINNCIMAFLSQEIQHFAYNYLRRQTFHHSQSRAQF